METFGRFTLLKRLGAGGMGEVFLARAQGESTPVVLKRILPHLTENPRFLKLFLDETRIASRLTHPNIARILELGESQGTWFVAMEHVPGNDLRELLKRAREQESAVPVEVAVAIGIAIARALEHAHAATDAQGRSLKIVHRDVSPHNVLVAAPDLVKLIDFGVAKAANKAIHTQSGILKGKFPYMAPEQANAKPVDARTDVFALGIVLWETLAGRHLFRGKSDAQTLKQVRACEVRPLRLIRDDIPEAVDKVVLKALRKEAKSRHKSAALFREALEQVAADLPTPDITGWLESLADVPGLDSSAESPVDVPTQLEAKEVRTVMDAQPNVTVDAPEQRNATRVARRISSRSGETSAEGLTEAKEILSRLSGRPTNIGAQVTSFVGRVAELADLHQLFRQGVRLLSLMGPGGIGKTRLSLQFGSQLVTWFQAAPERGARRGGVWFCDLTEARTLDDICQAVARALGVPLSPGDAVKQLGHAIAARGEVLLVLDNFEQVVAHASSTLELWMRASPAARFVVSTRELLRVPNEVIFEVPPLRVPAGDVADGSAEAVQLFVERARVVRPGWQPTDVELKAVAEIVRQLDGMPLAIELAAARTAVLSPTQLAQRLPRRFELLASKQPRSERQDTLRGAIDWSWRMLSPPESQALAQLSVFRGGFNAEAVEAVLQVPAGDEISGPLEALMLLRSKSLVRAYFPAGDEGETRFGLYESIREYAREKLSGTPVEAETLERHAKFYLGFGARLAAQAESSAQVLDQLDLERDNLNVVFQRAVESQHRSPRALQAVLALDPLLTLRGPFLLHPVMLDAALEKLKADDTLRAEGLEARGRARLARGKLSEAEADMADAKRLGQERGDQGLEGRAEAYLGLLERLAGQRGTARRRFENARALLKKVGDRRMEGRTLSNLAVLLHELGGEDEAMEAYNEALQIHRAVQDRRYEGVTLSNLGVLQQALGLLKQARANYEAALAIHRELGNRRSMGISHINLGDLCCDLDLPGQAEAHYEDALRILRESGAHRFVGVTLASRASLHLERGELEPAEEDARAATPVLQEVGDHRYQGLTQAVLAATLGLQGRHEAAMAALLEATRLLTEAGDAGFLDALDVYRALVELSLSRAAPGAEEQRLHSSVLRRLAHAERAAAPDERHPTGMPSPADRSEHVRAAVRSLKRALSDQ